MKNRLVFLIVFVMLFLSASSLSRGVLTGRAQGAAAWEPNKSYQVGNLASYAGITYRCIQGHTSLVGWEPPNVPALWQPNQGFSTATAIPPTDTPRPTNTAVTGVPTATQFPSLTPRPTNTSVNPPTATSSGQCTAPAWVSSAVYTADNRVSFGGHEWRAKWWTTNEQPGTTGQYGVWEDRGTCGAGGTQLPTATPSRTNTPQATFNPPTNTPGASTPTWTPQASITPGGSLPAHLLIGYWHNFDNGSGFIRLRNVNSRWNVINIAFAEPSGTSGTMAFVPYIQSVAEFKADVAYLQSQGKKVVISLGGANGQITLSTASIKTNFVNSMVALVQDYGFNGIDIDFEGSSVGLNQGDSDLRNPTSPAVLNLISAIRDIRARVGSSMMLTMAPETANVQGGLSIYGGPWGAYLPVIHATRDILSFVHVQHYNTGSMLALDGRAYSQATADFHVAMAEMLLQGFNAPSGSANFFPPLRADQVAIGLPSAPNAASGGYTTPDNIEKAVRYLAQGRSFGGTYTLRNAAGYPAFRGLMTWSINWDVYNNSLFSTTSRALLDSLP